MSEKRQRVRDQLDGNVTLEEKEAAWMLENEAYLVVKESGVYTVYGNGPPRPTEKLKTTVVDEVVEFLG
jgi:hypothetical protein